MPRRPWFQWFGAALSAWLLAGCASPTVSPTARPARRGLDPILATPEAVEADIKRQALAHARYANGVVLEVQHRQSQALQEFREAALAAPEDQDLVWEVARKFLAAREPATAIELLQRSAGQPDTSALTWARLSAIELQTGDIQAAIDAGQRAVERDPRVVQGHQSVFLAHLQAGHLDQARAVLEAAQAHSSGNPEFLIQLSELYGLIVAQEPGDRKALQATRLRLADQAAALAIEEELLRLKLADLLAELGQDERAAALYQELLETVPDAPGVRDVIRSKLTEVYLRGKDPLRARAQLERMLERDPTNVRVCYLLGSLAYQAGAFESARDYFERVLVLRPDFEQAYYDLAGILLNLDLVDEAEGIVSRARHKFPQRFAMEMLSAMIHVRREEFSAAIGHFTTAEITAQATAPERLTHFFYFQYGAACERAGEYTAAERHLKKAIEIDPGFAPALNYLGYMWADRGEHLEEALELIQDAVDLEPENAAYLDSLAWALFKLDRVEEAHVEIQRALEHLDEPDPTVHDHLGDILARLGRLEEAADAWRRAYELEPSSTVGEKLEDAGYPPPALPAETPANE